MRIRDYITKDLIFGAVGGSILATIITSIIDTKELELSNEELRKAVESLEKYSNLVNEQNKVIEKQNKTQKEANNKIKELMDKLNNYIAKEAVELQKEKEEQERKEKAKEAIKNKKWDEVYRMTERWYNHYPVQMSRSEVFTNLEKDGYITQEERTEAYNYFGSLWNYVDD